MLKSINIKKIFNSVGISCEQLVQFLHVCVQNIHKIFFLKFEKWQRR